MRKNMLFLYIILLVAVLGLATVVAYVIHDRSFDACIDIVKRNKPENVKTRIKIAIIGDSWVTDRKLDAAVADGLSVAGIPADVVSSGQPGAVSRDVYRNLTSETATPYSSRHFLMDGGIDYMVVLAGANDTVEHIGRDYYVHHMLCIIRTIQAGGIYPVILEIPEYGIEITPPKSFQNFAKRLVYRVLYDGGRHDVIQAYRDAFFGHLTPDMKRNLTIVEYAPLSTNYEDTLELYENPNHLNEKGYLKLGRMIAEAVAGAHHSRQQPNTTVRR